jgi:hypothetical protein
MKNNKFDPIKITDRLDFFNYRYHLAENDLKIFLPMLCYLKIDFRNGKVSMTSHITIALRSLTLEYNFLIYGLGLILLSWFHWNDFNKGAFVLLALMVVYFVICFIKLGALRGIVHQWIAQDDQILESKVNNS